jgi:hypothetical protein
VHATSVWLRSDLASHAPYVAHVGGRIPDFFNKIRGLRGVERRCGARSHVVDHHMEIAPKSASHNAPAPLAPSISRQRTLHRKSSNFHRWGQMHVCHLAEH